MKMNKKNLGRFSHVISGAYFLLAPLFMISSCEIEKELMKKHPEIREIKILNKNLRDIGEILTRDKTYSSDNKEYFLTNYQAFALKRKEQLINDPEIYSSYLTFEKVKNLGLFVSISSLLCSSVFFLLGRKLKKEHASSESNYLEDYNDIQREYHKSLEDFLKSNYVIVQTNFPESQISKNNKFSVSDSGEEKMKKMRNRHLYNFRDRFLEN